VIRSLINAACGIRKSGFGSLLKNIKIIVFFFLKVLIFFGGALSFAAFAGPGQLPEYKVKAVFIYNFAKFVEWPAEEPQKRNKVLTICVLGDDPFGANFNVIRGKTIKGRAVESKTIMSIEKAKDCDCLFISESEKSNVGEILGDLKDYKVLTISDMDGFLDAGGIIQFVLEKSKVRFLINMGVAKRAGFKVSSKLLELAKKVKN
jgi:YfiR/HmsC-like